MYSCQIPDRFCIKWYSYSLSLETDDRNSPLSHRLYGMVWNLWRHNCAAEAPSSTTWSHIAYVWSETPGLGQLSPNYKVHIRPQAKIYHKQSSLVKRSIFPNHEWHKINEIVNEIKWKRSWRLRTWRSWWDKKRETLESLKSQDCPPTV